MSASSAFGTDFPDDRSGPSDNVHDSGLQSDPRSRSHPRVILASGPANYQLKDVLGEMGYCVTEYLQDQIPNRRDLGEFEAIIIPVSPKTLSGAFAITRQVNTWRFTQTQTPLGPEIIVVATPQLSSSTLADFREQFCRVIFDSRTQLHHELQVIAVERERLRKKGILLLFFDIPGSTPRVFLAGRDGRQAEMDLNAREVRLLRKLGSEHRAFCRSALAASVGCKQEQIKVYVERIKAEYEARRREVGILMSKQEFIKNPGHGFGYWLHAKIKTL